MDFHQKLKIFLSKEYPGISLKGEGWRHIFFPEAVALKSEALEEIQEAIAGINRLKRDPLYIKELQTQSPFPIKSLSHPQDSVLTAFDFHIDSQGRPKLIEINTNGSGFLIANALAKFHGLPCQTALKSLKASFEEEWRKFQTLKAQQNAKAPPRRQADAAKAGRESREQSAGAAALRRPFRIAIIDDDLFSQKMLIEFFMYKRLFESWGWQPSLIDISLLQLKAGRLYASAAAQARPLPGAKPPRASGEPAAKKEQAEQEEQNAKAEGKAPPMAAIDMCYNRSTDFYFAKSPHLLKAFSEGLCAFSPHPVEHFLISHKDRLCEWPGRADLEPIRHVFLKTERLSAANKDFAWANRKRLFFKPADRYGGKGAYRGKGLTSKAFQRLFEERALFQELCPPALYKDRLGHCWKFDLRVFAYGSRIQQTMARCYQGPVTNFKSLGGGMAPALFTGRKPSRLILPGAP